MPGQDVYSAVLGAGCPSCHAPIPDHEDGCEWSGTEDLAEIEEKLRSLNKKIEEAVRKRAFVPHVQTGRFTASRGVPVPKQGKKPKGGRRAERSERRIELRKRAVARAGDLCEWSGCGAPHAHMAHIEGSALGGRPGGETDSLENVMMLCVYHHDLLDGRTDRMRLREIGVLLLELNERRHGG